MTTDTTQPILSIVTPTHNAEKSLKRCLNSILAQTFQAWELLIIDSLSRDNTLTIARNAAEKDARIKIISEADSGVYDAMNKGIRIAQGQWIYFLGADDTLFDESIIERMLGQNSSNYDFLYGNVLKIPEETVYDGEFDIAKLLSKNICHQAIFYRKSVFERAGYFDTRFPVLADWAMNIKCMLSADIRVKFVDTIIARFQTGGLSTRTKSLDSGWEEERMRLLEQHFQLGPSENEHLRAIIQALLKQTNAAASPNVWKERHRNLMQVHNNLKNSYSYRISRSLTWPVRVLKLAIQQRSKAQ